MWWPTDLRNTDLVTTRLLRGGHIHTEHCPSATAMLVRDGAIVWVGDDDQADADADAADEVIELDGALVTPAFVDAHVHLSQTGLALTSLDLSTARSLADALEALAAYARDASDAVLLGFGWDETDGRRRARRPVPRSTGRSATESPTCPGSTGTRRSRQRADRAAPAITAADGWDGAGRVERAAHHVARDAVQDRLGPVSDAMRFARARHAASLGLGCVHEIGAPHINPPERLRAIRRTLASEASIITVLPYWGELHAVEGSRAWAAGARR